MSTRLVERPRTRASQRGRPTSGDEWRGRWERWSRATAVALSAALVRARSRRRVSAILVLHLLVTAAIGWRLVDLQVLSADRYRELGIQQTHRELVLPARRGEITDREGHPLAMSLTAATVYAQPPTIAASGLEPAAIAAPLAAALSTPEAPVAAETVLADLRDDDPFVYVARQVPREVGERITDLALPGIGVLEEPTRAYPNAPLAAPLIGLAGTDHVGLTGLEVQYDEVLTGEPGALWFERAPKGLEITAAPREAEPPVAGTDVVLTLDREIQAAAEAALNEAVAAHEAEGGAALVLDVSSGEVLALATADTHQDGQQQTRAITDVYEPGSVNKVITLAAALEEGLVTPSTVMAIPTSHTVGGKTFSEAHPPEGGTLTVSEVMVRSSNVGTIRVAEQLGADRLHDYARRFGYGQTSGIDFPGETAGLLPEPAEWSGTSLPTIAIGHGVSATLLQVAGVYATIANGGEWVQPSLVRGTRAPGADVVASTEPERRQVVSETTARSVATMLGGVVESEHGTGAAAAVPGYTVAGKTGTARKPLEGARGYEDGAYIASFTGFAPVDDPRLVVAVMLDEPRGDGGYYGGQVAAPVFSRIMGFALGHERVAPSPGASDRP